MISRLLIVMLCVAMATALQCYVGSYNNIQSQMCTGYNNTTTVCMNYIQSDGAIIFGCNDNDACISLKTMPGFQNVTCCNVNLCNNSSYSNYAPQPILYTPSHADTKSIDSSSATTHFYIQWCKFFIILILFLI
jgi:hypothetical protein